MIIGYDAKRLFHNNTGLGYYSRNLIQSLVEEPSAPVVVLYDIQPKKSALTQAFFEHEKIKIVTLGRPGWYYRSVNMNKWVNHPPIDIYHGLSNELPIIKWRKKLPTVVTLHDILYQSFPADFPWLDRKLYHFKTKNALAKADIIIAISEATRKEVLQNFKLDENKIKVIYQSYDPVFNIPVPDSEIHEFLKQNQLPENYLLYVGAVTFRKNLMVILKSLQSLPPQKRMPLVVAGDGKEYLKIVKNYILEHHLEKWVSLLPNLPRQAIKILYCGAEVLIYPSLGEGFGLPVLESIACNTPVITSNLSSMPEAGGEVAQYIDPQNAEELTALLQTLNKKAWQKNHEKERVVHLEKFERSTIAGKYLNLYKSLLVK